MELHVLNCEITRSIPADMITGCLNTLPIRCYTYNLLPRPHWLLPFQENISREWQTGVSAEYCIYMGLLPLNVVYNSSIRTTMSCDRCHMTWNISHCPVYKKQLSTEYYGVITFAFLLQHEGNRIEFYWRGLSKQIHHWFECLHTLIACTTAVLLEGYMHHQSCDKYVRKR